MRAALHANRAGSAIRAVERRLMAGDAADISVDRKPWIEEQQPPQGHALRGDRDLWRRHVLGQGLEQRLRLLQELLVIRLGDRRQAGEQHDHAGQGDVYGDHGHRLRLSRCGDIYFKEARRLSSLLLALPVSVPGSILSRLAGLPTTMTATIPMAACGRQATT